MISSRISHLASSSSVAVPGVHFTSAKHPPRLYHVGSSMPAFFFWLLPTLSSSSPPLPLPPLLGATWSRRMFSCFISESKQAFPQVVRLSEMGARDRKRSTRLLVVSWCPGVSRISLCLLLDRRKKIPLSFPFVQSTKERDRVEKQSP